MTTQQKTDQEIEKLGAVIVKNLETAPMTDHTYLENRIKAANERIDFLTKKIDNHYNVLTQALMRITELEKNQTKEKE